MYLCIPYATMILTVIGAKMNISLVIPTFSKHFKIANPRYSCTRYNGYDIPAIHVNATPIGAIIWCNFLGKSNFNSNAKQRNTAITTQ